MIYKYYQIRNYWKKIYGTYEEPLFLAKGVTEWSGHSQISKMLDVVHDEEKLMRTLFLSGQKIYLLINIIISPNIK